MNIIVIFKYVIIQLQLYIAYGISTGGNAIINSYSCGNIKVPWNTNERVSQSDKFCILLDLDECKIFIKRGSNKKQSKRNCWINFPRIKNHGWNIFATIYDSYTDVTCTVEQIDPSKF